MDTESSTMTESSFSQEESSHGEEVKLEKSGKANILELIVTEAVEDNIQQVSGGNRVINYEVKAKKERGKEKAKGEKKDKKDKKQKKQILFNQAGEVKPGQVLAIMGSSGAGKTSLLNVLAKRVTAGVTGKILLNGEDIDANRFRRIAAYVQQDDVMLPWLSVRETLRFAATLRLPSSLSKEQKNDRVEAVIEELGLFSVADTPIGLYSLLTVVGSPEKRGISGGERKRVTIGIELITNPSLIFLDEPTSGLDSFTALNVMETLVNLARKGRTVVCTIHQPRSNIFDLMDQLLVLASGQILYFGKAHEAVDYWAEQGFDCPTFTNPADFFIDTTTLDLRTAELRKKSTKTVKKFVDYWAENYQQKYKAPKKLKAPSGGEKYAVNKFKQFWAIYKRAALAAFRDKPSNIIRTVQTVLVTLLISFLYYQMDTDQTSITDRSGAMYFLMINSAFGQLIGSLATFYAQRGTFLRERSNGTYSVGAYYWAKTLAELPLQIIFPLFTSLVCYWIMGFRNDVGAYFIFVLVLWLVSLVAGSLGFFLGSALPTQDAANAAAPFFLVIFIVFGGFYVNSINIPDYFIWIEKISFFSYGFRALLINEFWNATMTCKDDQYLNVTTYENGTAISTEVCPLTSGEQVLKIFGVDYDHSIIWQNVGVLVAMAVIYRILAYFGLRFITGRGAS